MCTLSLYPHLLDRIPKPNSSALISRHTPLTNHHPPRCIRHTRLIRAMDAHAQRGALVMQKHGNGIASTPPFQAPAQLLSLKSANLMFRVLCRTTGFFCFWHDATQRCGARVTTQTQLF
jgi:hypothetical protein